MCTDVMARGIDIPDVRWVLQFDPPTNAEAFVHRCGRTARIGHQGSAIIFLMPSEDAYTEFIKLNQNVNSLTRIFFSPFHHKVFSSAQVTLQAFVPLNSPLPNHLNEIRSWQRNDRSIFDKAQRAFVSYVQAYSKHECKWVLRVKGRFLDLETFRQTEFFLLILDLDFGGLATSFCLLKLPKMPELRNKKIEGFTPDNHDLNMISYK